MATVNPFDLLGDDDNDDPSQLIAAQQKKIVQKKAQAPAQAAAAPQAKPAKLPSKPAPPAQAVREAKNEGGRGYGGRSGGRGYGRGRGGGGYNNENSFGNTGYSGGQGGAIEEPNTERSYDRGGGGGGYGGSRGGYRGDRRGGSSNGEVGDVERPRRAFERRSGTGRGGDFKRDGAGRGNWGTQADELAQVTEEVASEGEKNLAAEKPSGEEDVTEGGNKENPSKEPEEKEPEEMTLEEYQKVLEEKRKALLALKPEERKVGVDKELASMQQLSSKKTNDDIFVKLGSDKDKRKEIADKEEKAKKSLSINEFLKPVEGEKYFTPRGRGRGRGSRGGGSGGFGSGGGGGIGGSSGGGTSSAEASLKIEDPGQFPTLGGK